MALSKNLPNEFEETPKGEQISFDELEFEAVFEEDFTTISGKEITDVSEYTVFKSYDLDVGEDPIGYPEVTIFTNDDKNYDSLRLRLIMAEDEEVLDCYANIPKRDKNGYITNIRKGYDFYRTCYDFIYSVLRWKGEENVIDANGEEDNNFKRVNIIAFAKFVDQFNRIGIKVTKGNEDSDYNSFIIYKME